MAGEALRFDEHHHSIGEQIELPYPVTRALAWWIAAELVRRHPADLRVIETHPGGGQYDCLSLYRRNSGTPRLVAHLNLLGHITPQSWFDQPDDGPETRFNWFEVLAAQDRRTHVIAQLERIEGLSSPSATPSTTKASIGPRVLSRFATSASISTRRWWISNGVYDSSGMDGGIQDWVSDIEGVSLHRLPDDFGGEPAYRFWYVLDNEGKPFTAIDVDLGVAWRRDGNGEPIDLMAVYGQNGGRIDAVVRRACPDVE